MLLLDSSRDVLFLSAKRTAFGAFGGAFKDLRATDLGTIAAQAGIPLWRAGVGPKEKAEQLKKLAAEGRKVLMVGDGINDAPALAKATVGISMSDASQIAMQTAQVVLMNHGLKNLPMALGLGRHTYITIKENLFWAFAYNIVAIPLAAFGFLSPMIGALSMAFSDVVVIGN